MELLETLKQMEKIHGDNFIPMVERMKRKADAGLLEGITRDDIDKELEKINSKSDIPESVGLMEEFIKNLYEVNEAIESYDTLDDDISEEELNEYALLEFYSYFINSDLLNEGERWERTKEKISDWADDHDLKNKAIDTGKALATQAAVVGTGAAAYGVGDAIVRARHNAGKEVAKNLGEKIARTKLGSKIFTFVQNHPLKGTAAAFAAGGAILGGMGVLAHKLLKKIREKRRERQLTESLNFNYIFSESVLNDVSDVLLFLNEDEIFYLKNENEILETLISEAENYSGYNLLFEEDDNDVSDAKFKKAYDPENYIAKDILNKNNLETGLSLKNWAKVMFKPLLQDQTLDTNNIDKSSQDFRDMLNKISDEFPELQEKIDEIQNAFREKPLNRTKIKNMYSQFVSLYKQKKQSIKKSISNDKKIEKIESKEAKNKLLENININDLKFLSEMTLNEILDI